MTVKLSDPIMVGSMLLKNRIMMPAIHHLYGQDSLPSPRFNEYYWKRAEGGAALVVVGACRFDKYGANKSTLKLDCEEDIPSHRIFTDGMGERGCKCALQLYHAGRYMRRADVLADDEAIAPSAVYTPFTRETARAMTCEDIERVISDFAAAAGRALRAGYDAVEISASAGYLLAQFLSPLTNLREDEYGGSFENRAKFPLRVISAVREAVGGDYPLLLRLGGNDLVPGSNGSDECRRFAVLASGAGIDLISLTGGWHESRVPQLTGEIPRAGLLYLAEEIRREVDIPVAMANRMGDVRTASEAVALGQCDIVSMGRPLIADPELPNKAIGKSTDPIRPCLSCNQGCLAGTFFNKPVRCLSNALAGREYRYPARGRAENPKRLLVVGAGPAGCEFAVRAAERGHRVTLCERSEKIGGQLRLASALPSREEFGGLLDFYSRSIERLGIELCLNFKVEAGFALTGDFDEIILANGREYRTHRIELSGDAPPLHYARQIIEQDRVLGRRVAVIGGSFVGLELARKLARDGSMSAEQCFYLMRYNVESPEHISEMLKSGSRRVAVFEKGKIGAGYEPGIAWPVLDELGRFGVEIFKNTEVLSITGDGVNAGGIIWPCDDVVVCPGMMADTELRDALGDRLPVHVLGNASRLGRAIDAIEGAFLLASEQF